MTSNYAVAVGQARAGARGDGERTLAGHVRDTLGAASLALIVLVSIALVILAAHEPSFLSPVALGRSVPSWMAGPFAGVWQGGLPREHTLEWLVSSAFAVLFIAYAIVVHQAPGMRARWVVAAIAAVHLVFLLAPPLQYTDVFNYINYGRMGIVHHLNPYAVTPVQGPHGDQSYAFSNWHYLRSPYGPLFTLLTYALVPLGTAVAFWVLKLIMALCSLGLLALVWRLAVRLDRSPTRAVALVGLNPVVLVWGLGGVHIDFAMAFAVIAAYYLVLTSGRSTAAHGDERTGRFRLATPEFAAGCLLVAAVGIKASALIFLPLGLAAARRRGHMLAGMALAATVLGVATVLAFGLRSGGLSQQAGLVSPEGVPNLLGVVLGLGGATPALRAVLSAGAALLVLTAAARAWRRSLDAMTCACVGTFAAILTLGWSPPWYVLWALPFVALAASSRWRTAVLVYTVYVLIASGPNVADIERYTHFNPRSYSLGREHIQHFDHLASA